jgi:PAS domain S-box-containing protein
MSILETELFALLDHTSAATYAVTTRGEICSWNAAAEQLFGYAKCDVLHREIDDVLEARDILGTRALAGGRDAAVRQCHGPAHGIPNFDLEVRVRAGHCVWVNVSTIVFDNQRTGRRLFVRLAHDITQRRHNEELLDRVVAVARQPSAFAGDATDHARVALLSEKERRILTLLAAGTNPVTVASTLSISAQTLRNHLHRVNRKLRTRSRLEAVTHALRRGLIE